MRSEIPTLIQLEKASSSSRIRPRSRSAPRTRVAMQRQEAMAYRSTSLSNGSTGSLSKDHTDTMPGNATHNRVVINVGGRRFQTAVETLLKVPDTVLAELAKSHLAMSRDQQVYEYYFDRSADMFDHVINYYRSGYLHFTHGTCAAEVKAEMDFWKLPRTALAECCWLRYVKQREQEMERDVIRRLLKPADAEEKVLRVGDATAVIYDAPSLGGALSKFFTNLQKVIPEMYRSHLLVFLLALRSCRRLVFIFSLIFLLSTFVMAIPVHLVASDDMSFMGSLYVVFMTMTTVGFHSNCVQAAVGHMVLMSAATLGIVLISSMVHIFLKKYDEIFLNLEDSFRLKGKRQISKRSLSKNTESNDIIKNNS